MEIVHILVTCEDKREDDVLDEMKPIKEVREIKKDAWSIQCSNKSRSRINSKDQENNGRQDTKQARYTQYIDTGFNIDF